MLTEEEIKKASDEYIGYKYEVDESLSTTMRRSGFMVGATWALSTLNNQWLPFPENTPEPGEVVVIHLTGCGQETWTIALYDAKNNCWGEMEEHYISFPLEEVDRFFKIPKWSGL